ncbi:AMP-binding protein [Sneathiella chinensis]|uniref:Acyl-CoA synthetase n=1 Tax=Sneathiella chinensis TaxID=349750 RepID=A0ABQ5U9L1_9PROT|nr:AMP-binding protein [Sneathiella chinensis]GLQ08007.1 acyl-CoA synthetase [Sneathiella chinensis]
MHIRDIAREHPDKIAILMANTGETTTYRDLDLRSNQGAQLFRSLGLQIGDHIAFLLENHPRFFEICWAAQRAGLYYTAISSRLSPEEAAYIINDCGARLFLTSKANADLAAAVVPATSHVETRFMLDDSTSDYRSFEEAVQDMPTAPLTDECEGTDMLYSSGTTGKPKGVKPAEIGNPIGTDDSLYNVLRMLYGFREGLTYLSPAPLYHAAPLRYNMRVHRFGGTTIIMDKFDPENYLRLVQEHRVTHTQMVPTMFIRLLKLPEETRKRYDISSLEFAIHAAAPCPEKVKRQMLDWWGPIIFEYYGGTEGNGYCTVTPQEWLDHPGTVGRAVIGVLHVVGEDGEEVPTGETGTIYFSDGKDFSYHNDPDKTQESYNSKGWSTLGDVGHVDEDGFLYLTDRKAYMIISGGVNIYPQEIEDHLITHPKVFDVAVFGIPNEDFGEEVKAVVQPMNMDDAGEALAEELSRFCRDHISHVKCPRSIDFSPELPRHPTGKLYKRLLRDKYWEKAPAG